MRNILFLVFLSILFSCKSTINQEERIKEDVSFLASDALEGRQTGTEGEKKAAHYISNRFIELELQPKGTKKYLQPFTFKPKTNPHDDVKFDVNGDGTITGNNVIGFYKYNIYIYGSYSNDEPELIIYTLSVDNNILSFV